MKHARYFCWTSDNLRDNIVPTRGNPYKIFLNTSRRNVTRHFYWACCRYLEQFATLDSQFLGRLPNFGSRPNTMGGKFPSVRPYIRLSTKRFSDFDEIWYTGSTRWEMKKVMTMPGSKVKVRSPWKSEIRPFWTIFNSISSPIYNGADKWPQILKLGNRSDFWNSSSFSVTWPLNFDPNHIWRP